MTKHNSYLFVSYARDDIEIVRPIIDSLQREYKRRSLPVHVWVDIQDLRPGQQWHRELERVLLDSIGLLVFVSPAAMQSDWVHRVESFDDWLGRYLPTDVDIWLSDRRLPTPLETRYWAPDPRSDISWLRAARQAEFIAEVVGRGEYAGWVVVAASCTVQFATRRSEVRVESALVSPKTAPALVRALQTVTNPFNLF